MITTTYDPEADAFYLRLRPPGSAVAETEEVAPGVMLDFDSDGDVIGVEVLSVRRRFSKPVTAAEPKPVAAE